jgi:hypothetical protein
MWINGMYEKNPLLVKGGGVDEGVDNFRQRYSPVFIGSVRSFLGSICAFC